jgi:hypothetical protein
VLATLAIDLVSVVFGVPIRQIVLAFGFARVLVPIG